MEQRQGKSFVTRVAAGTHNEFVALHQSPETDRECIYIVVLMCVMAFMCVSRGDEKEARQQKEQAVHIQFGYVRCAMCALVSVCVRASTVRCPFDI